MALVLDRPLSLDWLGKDGGLGVSISYSTVPFQQRKYWGALSAGAPTFLCCAVLCRLRMMLCCGVLRYLRWIGSGSGLTGAKVGAGQV